MAYALKIEFEEKRFSDFWGLGIVATMAFPIRDVDPITCNQLISPIIDCRRNVRVKYNKQTHAAEYSLIIDVLLLLNREIYFFSVSLTSMEGASTSGLNCCSRDRKGKQRGGGERMTSENEISIQMRLLNLICSSSSCGNAFKSFFF